MTSAPTTSLHPYSRPIGNFLQSLSDLPDRVIATLGQIPLRPGLMLMAVALLVTALCWRAARRGMQAQSAGNLTVAKPCDWRVGSMRMASGAQKWHCRTCGRDGFSATKEPPEGCNRTETIRADAASA